MKTNNITLISFLGTEPSFKTTIQSSPNSSKDFFFKDLNLQAMKNFRPLLNNFEEELQLINKNIHLKDKLSKIISVIAEEMGLTIEGINPNMSAEDRINSKIESKFQDTPQLKSKNKKVFKPNTPSPSNS
jgi:hypothetical protein